MLSKKFFVLYGLCEQQLSKQPHYDFGLRNILSVLRTAGASKRANPDKCGACFVPGSHRLEWISSNPDAQPLTYITASHSFADCDRGAIGAPLHYACREPCDVSHISSPCNKSMHGGEFFELCYPGGRRSEVFLMMRTLRDMNMSKFVAEDVPLFLALIDDLFPNVKAERTQFDDIMGALKKVRGFGTCEGRSVWHLQREEGLASPKGGGFVT